MNVWGVLDPGSEAAGGKLAIGKWGRMHREYLREHHLIRYTNLILPCELWIYLADLNEQARERRDRIMQKMKETESVTDVLKAVDSMAWVQRMDDIHNWAEKTIIRGLIYGEGMV